MSRLHLRRVVAPALAVSMSMGIAVIGLSASSATAAGTPGVTATTITIGATIPESGIASLGYDEVAPAADAVFQWVNNHGGINGRKINFVLKDDCYDVSGAGCTGDPNTVALTQQLLALPVFATVGSLGTPTQESVQNLLTHDKVPQLFVNSGSAAWNNPKAHPYLFGWQQSYVVESKILGNYIKSHFKGQKVCFLGQSDDFGHGGLTGLKDVGVNPSPSAYYSVDSLVVGGASYMTHFVQAEQTANCKVVFLDTIPGATAAVLGNAAALHFSPHWVISSVGSDPITVAKEAGGAFSDVGATTFAELPASTDSNAWNAWDRQVLLADPSFDTEFHFTAGSPMDGNMSYGIGWGVSFVEALRAAGKNFTRASFVKTLLTTKFQTPALTPLAYNASNHQGLLGGYIDTVTSATATTAVTGKTVYVTTAVKSSKVTVTHRLSTTVPAWLKH
jgi:ABC-type branched-subunit amino acid transport system substrate-binding protein